MGVQAADIDMLEEYAPILYFEGSEQCYPVDVNFLLDEADLYMYDGTEQTSVLVEETPNAEALSGYDSTLYEYYFLDDSRGSVDSKGAQQAYASSGYGYKMYGRVVEQGSLTILQYWMFYAYNDGSLNTHEGDWESIAVVLDSGEPTKVFYSQHHGGQKANWELVQKNGVHPKVFVSLGSHANYLRSFSGSLGMAMDTVNDNGLVLNPSDYELEVLDAQGWLDFAGRWGEYGGYEDEVKGRVGPFGPQYREDGVMWDNPDMWGESLSSATQLMFYGEWFVYYFIWIFLGITCLSLAFLLFGIVKKWRNEGIGPRVISFLYQDGANIKTVGNMICIIGLILAIVGLFFPWFVVSADVSVPGFETEGMVDLIRIDGLEGIRLNMLDPAGGLSPLGSFAMPFWVFIGMGFLFFFIHLVGERSSLKAGRRYIGRGIDVIVPIVLVVIVIFLLPAVASAFGAAEYGDGQIMGFFNDIANSPFGGTSEISFELQDGTLAAVDASWGLANGGWLLLVGGILMIIAGLLEMMARTEYFQPKHKEQLSASES